MTASISTSLDGFVAGPNDSPENPLGDGGERLHEWIYDLESWRARHGLEGGETSADDEIVAELSENVGAVVMGRRMFSNDDGPWGDEPFEGHWGSDPPFGVPVFVLTHHPRDPLEMDGGTTFTFVTDGLESAVERAKDAAGDQDVSIAGGASVIRQSLEAGLLDELQIHLVPVLLGDGIRLFEHVDGERIELERTRVVASSAVTHLRFDVSTDADERGETTAATSTERRTTVRRVIEAPPDRVYDAFLDPDALAQWFPPSGVTAEVHDLDPVVSGSFRITFSFESHDAIEGARTFAGTFTELERNERIVYTEAFETEDPGLTGDMTVTITFEDVAGGTEVTVRHEGLPDAVRAEDNADGWTDSLENLARLVERP